MVLEQNPGLRRGLGLGATTSLVVGTIIGTGVFLKAANMAQAVGSPVTLLLAWLAAGVLSLAGALSYAELGAMLPNAGGEYVYLRAAYGDLAAFAFGWTRLAVASSGSIAGFGAAFALFLSGFVHLDAVWAARDFSFFGQTIHWTWGSQQLAAVGVILLFTVLNCFRTQFGGGVQSLLTWAKILAIAAIVIGVFFFAPTASWSHLRPPASAKPSTFSAFGAAMIAALWAYDGWNNMPMAAGEVREPGRNVPRALILGMAIVLIVYGLVNIAYCYALPISEIAACGSSLHSAALPVAARASETFLPHYGARIVGIAAMLSTAGALHGSILTNARVPYAMARDGLFFARFAVVGESSAAPVPSIVLTGIWSCFLAVSATFDQLTDSVIFAEMIFYVATTAAVFVLRRKMPNATRPYRTLGYPFVPGLFIAVAIWLLANTLINNALLSMTGLALIVLGLPLFWFMRRIRNVPVATIES